MIKKDSCLEGKTSVPIGTEVYGIIYSKFKIIKGNLIELISDYWRKGDYKARIYVPATNEIKEFSVGCVYTKLEDVYATIRHWIINNNEIYLKNLKDAQNDYNKFINSIPEEYKYLIDENNKECKIC